MKVGDVVRHVDGGPPMTIRNVIGQRPTAPRSFRAPRPLRKPRGNRRSVACMWFVGDHLCSALFPVCVLEPCEPA